MYSRENKLAKNAGNHPSSTAPSPFQPRSFDIQAASEPKQSSSSQAEIETQAERPTHYGINLLTIPVHAPETAPPSAIQTKLTIGQAGDKYKQEADSVAAQVVNQIHSPNFSQSNQGAVAQRQSEQEGKKQEEKEVVQTNSLAPPQRRDTNLLTKMSIFEPGKAAPSPIQTQPIFGRAKSETAAQPDLSASIQKAPEKEQPLADSSPEKMNQEYGGDPESLILLDGDIVNFKPNFGYAMPSVKPGVLKASGKSILNGKRVCVEGDEQSVVVPDCVYFSSDYPIPGIGRLKIAALSPNQKAKQTNSAGIPVLLKGSIFTAMFEVLRPATTFVSTSLKGSPVDPSPFRIGTGTFTTTNNKWSGS